MSIIILWNESIFAHQFIMNETNIKHTRTMTWMKREEETSRYHRSASLYFSLIDLWLTKDNRLLNPKSSYERILMAPTCRLIARFLFLVLISLLCLYLYVFFFIKSSMEKRLLALRIYYLHPLPVTLFIIWFQHLLVFF